jgi:hypothetical protein
MAAYFTALLIYISFLIIILLFALLYGKIVFKKTKNKLSNNYETIFAVKHLCRLAQTIQKEYFKDGAAELDKSFVFFKDILDLSEQLDNYEYKEFLSRIHFQVAPSEISEELKNLDCSHYQESIIDLMELKEQFILNVICYNLNLEYSELFSNNNKTDPEIIVIKALTKELKRLKRQDKVYTLIICKIIEPLRTIVDNVLKKIKLFDNIFAFFHRSMAIIDYSKRLDKESVDELISAEKEDDMNFPVDILVVST